MPVTHGEAIIVEANIIDGAPIRAVTYLQPEDARWDSGYALFLSEPDTTIVCLTASSTSIRGSHTASNTRADTANGSTTTDPAGTRTRSAYDGVGEHEQHQSEQ